MNFLISNLLRKITRLQHLLQIYLPGLNKTHKYDLQFCYIPQEDLFTRPLTVTYLLIYLQRTWAKARNVMFLSMWEKERLKRVYTPTHALLMTSDSINGRLETVDQQWVF